MIAARSTLCVVALVALAACSGGMSPSPTEPPPTSTSAPPETTIPASVYVERFEECLADHDLAVEPIPLDPTGRPRLDLVMPEVDFSDPAQVEALSICALHLSSGALDLTGEPVLTDLVLENLAEFSECMRSHGVPGFPDPVTGFAGAGGPFEPREIPFDDPDLESAAATCSDRLVGQPS